MGRGGIRRSGISAPGPSSGGWITQHRQLNPRVYEIGASPYLDRWDTRWADTRIHGTTKRQVAAMFAEEQPALQPLPVEPFRYYRFGVRTVHLDGCVEVEAAYYGAPPGWIGRRVDVQWNDLFVRLLDPKTGQLLSEHVRAPRGWHRIEDADRPRR